MTNTYGPEPRDLIESVDHAMRLLLLLQDSRELRVTTVAAELGVARSTAHRLLATLAYRGFVAQDRATKVYRAGRSLVQVGLSSISELDVRRKAHRHMEDLAAVIDETINLLVLEGDGCRFIDGVESSQAVKVSVRTGTLLPAYATAGGKVLIADLSAEELRAVYPHGLRKITPRTTTSIDKLADELATVRKRGYALNFEESALGLCAIAVPVTDRTGRTIAALAVSAPAQRLDERQVPEIVKQLKTASTLIRADLS